MNHKFILVSHFSSLNCPGFIFLLKVQKIGLFSSFNSFKKGFVFVVNKSSHVHNKSKGHYKSNDQYKSILFIGDFFIFKSVVRILLNLETDFYWKIKVKNV